MRMADFKGWTPEQMNTYFKGMRFERLVIQEILMEPKPSSWTKYSAPLAVCLCDCGNTKTVKLTTLFAGQHKSCGCLRIDSIRRVQAEHVEERIGVRKQLNKIISIDPYFVRIDPVGKNPNNISFLVDTVTWLWLAIFPWSIGSGMGYMETSIMGVHIVTIISSLVDLLVAMLQITLIEIHGTTLIPILELPHLEGIFLTPVLVLTVNLS